MDGSARRFKFLIPIFLFCFLNCQPHRSNDHAEYFPVTRVVDGDTFWVDDGTAKGVKIRLIGVDAPETRKSARKDVGYYGTEAKVYLSELIADKEVKLEYDVDRKDRYGRVLAYAYLPDGTFINADLVKRGYAMVLTVPPNVKFADLFVKLQREARNRKRGLWKEKV